MAEVPRSMTAGLRVHQSDHENLGLTLQEGDSRFYLFKSSE